MMDLPKTLTVNGTEYLVISLLGKGKGGYSYLVECEGEKYVLKQIHHEPCEYYSFGNKIESEIRDYNTLLNIGIRMPRLFDVDIENERILKEYIDGKTVMALVRVGELNENYINQVKEMCSLLYPAGLNIDYYPTNFVPNNGLLYYIDYECNIYSDEWNFENWGIKYWINKVELD